MEQKLVKDDLRYCIAYLNNKVNELYDEIRQVEFNYALFGGFDILLAPDFKGLKSFHITHLDDYTDYLKYLNTRLNYVYSLRANVKEEFEKKDFDPDLVSEDIYDLWVLVMEIKEE